MLRKYIKKFLNAVSEGFCIAFLGYKIADENPPKNIPRIGEVCWIKEGHFLPRQAVLKERPLEKRLTENDFRFYFEMIDGTYINLNAGLLCKPSGDFIWECDPQNPNRKIL